MTGPSAQDRHFAEADAGHFYWTTRDPGFAPLEDELLRPHVGALASPCLEIGCGEGSNLLRLVRPGRAVFGIDRSAGKVRFAADAIAAACVAVADAGALPFRTAAFRGVFVRDVMHHVPDPARALAEAARVLAPAGVLLLIEPNGRNPLVRLQARVMQVERRLLRFSPASVRALLDDLPFAIDGLHMAQAFPLRRLVLHPRFGLPVLGRHRVPARLLERLEQAIGRWLPPDRWSYTVIAARRT